MALFHSFFYGWVLLHFIYITSSLSIHLDIWVFSILAIVNSATMSMEGHISFWINGFFSLHIYPRVEMLGHMVVLLFIFWGPSILFSIVAAPIYIPINSVQHAYQCTRVHTFPHILTSTFFWSFWDNRFVKCEAMSHHGFDFAFSSWLVMLSIFPCSC